MTRRASVISTEVERSLGHARDDRGKEMSRLTLEMTEEGVEMTRMTGCNLSSRGLW